MAYKHPVQASVSVNITEFNRDPMSAVARGEGAAVAILNANEPVFYAVPVKAHEALLEELEDRELAAIVEDRLGQSEIELAMDEL
tara:strand:- start:2551 stop:2805 length:255 start_codon:yes stop_codon:yes gene_type:complete